MKQIAFVTFLMLNGALAFAQSGSVDMTTSDNSAATTTTTMDYTDGTVSGSETGFYSGYGASSRIYTVPSTITPTTTTALGRAPQFPALRHINSADEMYSSMKGLADDPTYGTELNNLFIGMGYTGVNDPAFGPEDLEQAKIPYGAMGLMGGRGNSYRYTMIALPGKPSVDAWHVKPQTSGKDLYFFAACGNAFYYSNAPRTAEVIKEKYINDYSGYGKVKVQVYARSKVKTNCTWCGKCADWTDETVLLSEDDLSQIPVAKDGDTDLPVRKVYVDMDQKTFSKIKAKEENGEYKMKTEE